jgi:4'-phosphopantetheinyl transferase
VAGPTQHAIFGWYNPLVCTVRVVWQLVEDDPGAADRLLVDEVADVMGCSPDELRVTRFCPRCGSAEHGRPGVVSSATAPTPHVSVARASGVVVVAVSTDAPVGVDVEKSDLSWPPGSTEVLLHPLERAEGSASLTTHWVRKESLLKASGEGLRVEPSFLRLTDPGEAPRLLEWPEGPEGAVAMRDLEIDGCTACVSVLGHETVRVTQRQAGSGSGGRSVWSSHASNSSSSS